MNLNWSIWLPYITVGFVTLTVAVGLIGLRQGHYSRGKLTKRGRQAVALITGLGAVTLVSSIADQQISAAKEQGEAEKEKAEANLRTQRFDRQMASLEQVTGDLGRVRSSLRESIREQEKLYGVAAQNLRMSAQLQRQEQANTLAVLRRVFAEGNQVSAERIAVSVSLLCFRENEITGNPELGRVALSVSNASDRIYLTSRQKMESAGNVVFFGFLGDLGSFESFDAWRDASVIMGLTASFKSPAIEEAPRPRDPFDVSGGIPQGPGDCSASAHLLLNGRRILTARGDLERTANSYHVEFTDLWVDPGRFPQF